MSLLCLTYTFLLRQLLKKGDSSIVIAPATDPQDLRPESETPSQRAPTSHAPSKSVSSDVVNVAFAFGQVLRPLLRHQAYVSKACKAVYQPVPEARDILARCEKLKGLVSTCPYLSMKGYAQGGTYIIVLDV